MDTQVINECGALSLAGKITFPEVVGKLSAAGVERYIADLVGLQTLYYGTTDERHMACLSFSDASAVARTFDAAGVKNAITDSQQQKINYQTFLRRIMAAGCGHYEVYISGRKAIYFGRDGSQHIELFPTAPASPKKS